MTYDEMNEVVEAKKAVWSHLIGMKIRLYMDREGLKRADVAERLGCSPQYVGRILNGQQNLSLFAIAEIEHRLGLKLIEIDPYS